MRKILTLASAFTAATLAASVSFAAHAGDGPFVDARISTLGAGIDIGTKLSPYWDVRLLANGFDYSANRTVDDIRYDGKLKMASWGAQVDWHPMANGPLYLTAGLYSNGNKLNAQANPSGTVTIGDLPFTSAEVGNLYAHGKFKSTAPYLGIGGRWGAGPIDFTAEAGAYFQGKAHVTLTNDGVFASNSTFQAQLEVERQNLEHNLNDFSTYPVVALGVGYHF
jgi:hypothetical protein